MAHPEAERGIGLQHTRVWTSLYGRLQRLCMQHKLAATRQEREGLVQSFSLKILQQAREYASATALSQSEAYEIELNRVALLSIASAFDTALQQQTTRTVQALLSAASSPSSSEDEASSSSSLEAMFMRQATSTITGQPAPNSPSLRPSRQIAHDGSPFLQPSPQPDSPAGGLRRNWSGLFTLEQ